MSDLTTMDVRKLRNEVQDLRDELALMKRKFEDILYNLDTDNFSPRVVKQGNDMYTKIEQNAEGITLQAEKIDENVQNLASLKVTADEIESAVFEKITDENGNVTEKKSKIEQTAEAITSEVTKLKDDTDTKFESYSTTEQTAELIKSTVDTEYVNSLAGLKFVENSVFNQTAGEITASVSQLKEDTGSLQNDIKQVQENVTKVETTASGLSTTVSALTTNYNTMNGTITALGGSVTKVEQTADGIALSVSQIEKGEFKGGTLFTQDSGKFVLSGDVEISGDLISGGTISGANFSNASQNTFLTIGDSKGAWGDLRLVSKWSNGELTTFQIYEAAEGVIMSLYENPVMEVSSDGSGSYTYAYVTPKGTWDFSDEENCTLKLPDGIGGGGTATAVFG